MDDLREQILDLMLKNRRVTSGYQYTLPSPDSFPYQWFWDSCFHAIILSHFNTEDAKKELLSLVSKQFENGMIPHMIYWEKNSKSDFPAIEWGKEETSTITQPPMLAFAVWQIYLKDKDKNFLEIIYPSLTKLYRYFLTQRDPRENHLISIINPDESGEDNSPRFDHLLNLPPHHSIDKNFKRRLELIKENKLCNFDAPFCMKNFFWVKDVPINVILIENLKVMSDIAIALGKDSEADFYFTFSKLYSKAMKNNMLDHGVFYSLYMGNSNGTSALGYNKILVRTWAIFAPLFAGLVTQTEAESLVKNYLLNPNEFNTPFLVPTVSRSEPSFDPKGYWRGPVWFATNWFIYKGLKKYGLDLAAKKILEGSLALIKKSGFREQFDPITGEGLGAGNFTWAGLVIDMT